MGGSRGGGLGLVRLVGLSRDRQVRSIDGLDGRMMMIGGVEVVMMEVLRIGVVGGRAGGSAL